MRFFVKAAAAFAVVMAAGCTPGALYFHDERIDGPYRLRAVLGAADMQICYERSNGACDCRIPGRVFAVAHDEDFIVAAVRPPDDPSKKVFYYIVRAFDGPRADVERAVRGPYANDAFVKEMKEHGVPAPDQVIPPR